MLIGGGNGAQKSDFKGSGNSFVPSRKETIKVAYYKHIVETRRNSKAKE